MIKVFHYNERYDLLLFSHGWLMTVWKQDHDEWKLTDYDYYDVSSHDPFKSNPRSAVNYSE